MRSTTAEFWLAILGSAMVLALAILWSVSIVRRVTFTASNWHASAQEGSVIIDYSSVPMYFGQMAGWQVGEHFEGGSVIQRNPGTGKWATTPRTIVPLWIPLLVIAVPSVFLWFRVARAMRDPKHCSACGYDCTGVPEGAVCPECGKARVARATAHPAER
jgi:hypothetical protein